MTFTMTHAPAKSGTTVAGRDYTIVAAADAPQVWKSLAGGQYTCDGVNDHAEIAAAYAAGNVLLSPGTFNLGAQLVLTTSERELVGAEPEKTIIVIADLAEGVPGILFYGPRTYVGTTATISASIAEGAYSATMASDQTANLAAGDLVSISSADVFNPKRGAQTKGEFKRVKSITATTLTFTAPTFDAYTTGTIRIIRYQPIKNVRFGNFTVKPHAADTHRSELIRVENGEKITIDNLVVRGVNGLGGAKHGLHMIRCIDSVVNDFAGIDVYDANRGASTPTGYPLALAGCENVTVNRSVGYHNRHSFEVGLDNLSSAMAGGIGASTGDGGNTRLVNRIITFNDCVAEQDTSAGYSTHGMSTYIDFNNCTARGCGGGYAIRGSFTRLISPKVLGVHAQPWNPTASTSDTYARPFWIGEAVQQDGTGSDYAGISGTGVVIENAIVDITGITRYAEGGMSAGAITAAYIESYEPMINARIEGGHYRGGTAGFWFRGQTNDRLTIRDVDMDCASHFTGTYPGTNDQNAPLFLDVAAGAGFRSIRVLIESVRFNTPRRDCIVIRGGTSSATANVTTEVLVKNCSNYGTSGRALVKLVDATFFGLLRLVDNRNADSTIAQSYLAGTATVATLHRKANHCSDGYDVAP